MIDEDERLLAGYPIRILIEHVGHRLGLEQGCASLDVTFQDGRLRRAFVKHGPVGVEMLERLACREPPPLPVQAETSGRS